MLPGRWLYLLQSDVGILSSVSMPFHGGKHHVQDVNPLLKVQMH
jgi:hypothetical protein